MRLMSLVLGVIVAIFLSACYSIQMLPPLPGGGVSIANALNNSGVVVGTAGNAEHVRRAVIWRDGLAIEIPTPTTRAAFDEASDVNQSGAVVGSFGVFTPFAHPFIWREGEAVRELDTGGQLGGATAINDSGDVAGRVGQPYREGSHHQEAHVALWRGAGALQDLGAAFFESSGMALGKSLQIAGSTDDAESFSRATLWYDGAFHDLGTLGGNESYATAATFGRWHDPAEETLFVVGASSVGASATLPDGTVPLHAFVYNRHAMRDLGALPGFVFSLARSINASAVIVGRVNDTNGHFRAFVYRDGRMQDLNELLSGTARAHWLLMDARDINDVGQIVGYGLFDGELRGFILTPPR